MEKVIIVIILSFLGSILIYVGTALFLGKQKANGLPGGAFGCGLVISLAMSAPFYIGPVVALIGHYISVFIAKKL